MTHSRVSLAGAFVIAGLVAASVGPAVVAQPDAGASPTPEATIGVPGTDGWGPHGAPVPTKGRIPDEAIGPDGQIDPSKVPDFVPVLDRDGDIAGYAAYRDLEPAGGVIPWWYQDPPTPVYAGDLRTLVGFMFPGKGFVPLGTDPATVPDLPVGVIQEPSPSPSMRIPPGPDEHAVGEPFDVYQGDAHARIRVTNIRFPKQLNGPKAQRGHRFVQVRVSIQDVAGTYLYHQTDWSASADDRQLDRYPGTFHVLVDGRLAPGGSVSGWVTFEGRMRPGSRVVLSFHPDSEPLVQIPVTCCERQSTPLHGMPAGASPTPGLLGAAPRSACIAVSIGADVPGIS